MENYLQPVSDGLLTRPVGNWAMTKLDYLERYINIFEKSMRIKWPARNYIDLLAGPGKNLVRKSSRILLGSPLLALTTPYPFTGYFFADIDEQNMQALQQRCSASLIRPQISSFVGDCNVVVDGVVKKLRGNEQNSLNLAFLDPEGMELQWNTVAKIASVRRMDLIIYYPQMGLTRNMRQLFNSKGENAIDRFFGDKEWRDIYAKSCGKPGLHRNLIDLYKSKLTDLGYTDVFRGDEEGWEEPVIRNQGRNAPLYRLIFASKHQLGRKFWQEVVKRDVHGQMSLPMFTK